MYMFWCNMESIHEWGRVFFIFSRVQSMRQTLIKSLLTKRSDINSIFNIKNNFLFCTFPLVFKSYKLHALHNGILWTLAWSHRPGLVQFWFTLPFCPPPFPTIYHDEVISDNFFLNWLEFMEISVMGSI